MNEETLPWYREVGSKEWRSFIAAYLGWALDAMDSMLYSLVIVAVMKEYRLNSAQAGLLASVTFFAAGAGSWIYGILADRIGRKKTLMLSILTYSIATGLCGLAQNVTQLAIFRTLVGFLIAPAALVIAASGVMFFIRETKGHELIH